jgi:uroporphyrinogen III methyltransferase / synthase
MAPGRSEEPRPTSGKVYLVGAGPGASELITLKGKRCLEEAQVVIYDYLADRSLLQYAPPEAEKIYAGKSSEEKAHSQEEIESLIVQKAREGKVVVRLKGGDPFIFGRGGEEGEYLRDHKIPFEVVPGVSSAIAVPAYAGIPLTHRDYASSVAFIAGHEAWEVDSPVSWEHLTRGVHTMVFLMGMKSLAENMKRLMISGCDPERPVALIRWGTKGGQETLVGTVESIARLAEERGFKPPVIAVVGEVVNLRERLNWFETKPLFGRRILITRPRAQASAFSRGIEDLGGEVVEFPTIEILPPNSYDLLDRAINEIESYHWLIFTSVNGVSYFLDRMKYLEHDIRKLKGVKIAAIGPETAERLESVCLRVDLVPWEYRAEGILKALRPQEVDGKRVLLPRAAKARDVLPKTLMSWGAAVEVVEAYRTVPAQGDAAWLRDMLQRKRIDMITFTSSSTAVHFANLFPDDNMSQLLAGTAVACIGPITQSTVEEMGIRADVVPRDYTITGLIQAIVEHFSKD